MEIIVLPRQGGKTTKLLQLADGRKGYIVCPNLHRVDHIMKLARKYRFNIHMPITFREFLDGHYGGCVECVFIDDLDECLMQIAKTSIKAVTLTG